MRDLVANWAQGNAIPSFASAKDERGSTREWHGDSNLKSVEGSRGNKVTGSLEPFVRTDDDNYQARVQSLPYPQPPTTPVKVESG